MVHANDETPFAKHRGGDHWYAPLPIITDALLAINHQAPSHLRIWLPTSRPTIARPILRSAIDCLLQYIATGVLILRRLVYPAYRLPLAVAHRCRAIYCPITCPIFIAIYVIHIALTACHGGIFCIAIAHRGLAIVGRAAQSGTRSICHRHPTCLAHAATLRIRVRSIVIHCIALAVGRCHSLRMIGIDATIRIFTVIG